MVYMRINVATPSTPTCKKKKKTIDNTAKKKCCTKLVKLWHHWFPFHCACARAAARCRVAILFLYNLLGRARASHTSLKTIKIISFYPVKIATFSRRLKIAPSKHTPLWIAYDFLRMRKAHFSRNGLRVRCGSSNDDDEYWAFSFPHFHYKRTPHI